MASHIFSNNETIMTTLYTPWNFAKSGIEIFLAKALLGLSNHRNTGGA